jgi:DNA polymerase-3 subunit alpha
LKVIEELDFAAYFLITWDIIRYAQTAGYYHVGRGSGANSIVAYCLFITDVDPLELDLYFERFINPRRTTPPDFDIDFSWDERDDVTDYIFKRYGREHTALLATYHTFQHQAIVRELGKALGLPSSDIDLISDNLPALVSWSMRWGGRRGSDEGRAVVYAEGGGDEALFARLHPWARHLISFGQRLLDFPNYLSIHAGGIIISEQPLSACTALQQMPKGFPITHFDMYVAEDWGFHKFDILSQRGLGHIKDTIDLVKRNRGVSVEIHDVGAIKRDERVRVQLRSGRCMGCFYIESPAMRGLLTRLRCDNYIHLVAASSIIRPGVSQSGMMRAYIERYHQPHGFTYLHPVFKEHLGETFGVMVYQEDVMKILHHFAGLGLDEADVMRRMMTGKKRSSEAFARLERQYFDNCRSLGHPDALAQEVWRQIESFAGYSFCKAHSASFAVESFQSLYLKSYYPLEFMVGVINNFGGFYQTEFYVHEARMSGGSIHAPCVQRSRYLTDLQGTDIYLGFVHIKGFEQDMGVRVVEQRNLHGPYRSLEDCIRRTGISRAQVALLIRAGGFRFTGLSKTALLWECNRVMGLSERGVGQLATLFEEEAPSYVLPELDPVQGGDALDEMELLGFPLCNPFDLLHPEVLNGAPGLLSSDLAHRVGKRVEVLGYYVCRKDTRTVKGERMHFGTWLDRAGFFFDTVHFPVAGGKSPFVGRGLYRMEGRVLEEFGFICLECKRLERLPYYFGEAEGGAG